MTLSISINSVDRLTQKGVVFCGLLSSWFMFISFTAHVWTIQSMGEQVRENVWLLWGSKSGYSNIR